MMPQQPRPDKAGRLRLGFASQLYGSRGIYGAMPQKRVHGSVSTRPANPSGSSGKVGEEKHDGAILS